MYEFRLKMELLSKFSVVKKAFTPKATTIKHNLEKKNSKNKAKTNLCRGRAKNERKKGAIY